jgi:hypothetical protein
MEWQTSPLAVQGQQGRHQIPGGSVPGREPEPLDVILGLSRLCPGRPGGDNQSSLAGRAVPRGWNRAIRFARGAGGHMAALQVAGQARKYRVARLVSAHIGVPRCVIDAGYRPPFGNGASRASSSVPGRAQIDSFGAGRIGSALLAAIMLLIHGGGAGPDACPGTPRRP